MISPLARNLLCSFMEAAAIDNPYQFQGRILSEAAKKKPLLP
jgi:hypothetical protein